MDPKLRSVNELPDKYRQLFATRFSYFNQIQSQLLDPVVGTQQTLVICSPTASGKTVLLELAIVGELCRLESAGQEAGRLHVLYVAPLKAIIEEKCAEWSQRFGPLGVKCFALTGDTEHGDYQSFRASNYAEVNILLATPEKFDAMIRTCADSRQLLRLLQLVLIDEIHIIGDRIRGDVLEATITRIKAIRDSSNSVVKFLNTGGRADTDYHNSNHGRLRFVAISATAPNVEDLAAWLDIKNGLGILIPQDFRPVKLTKLVFGFEPIQSAMSSEYRFDIQLSYKLEKYIREYCNSKPTLVFCATRRSVEFTAKVLASSALTYFESHDQRAQLFYEMSKLSLQEMDYNSNNPADNQVNFKNVELRLTLASGVAFYHSGLDYSDRRLLEQLFALSLIPVLVSTSSLAMGVNLPAHLVVIKNTVQYNAGSTSEYDLSQILQMLGRAGRPQYDAEATAIILTKANKKERYESLLNKGKDVESQLFRTLPEQLITEVVLKTVTDIDQAIDWICSTFLFIRIVKNPSCYGSNIPQGNFDAAQPIIRNWCNVTMARLQSLGLIQLKPSSSSVEATHLGRIVNRHMISVTTTDQLIQLTKSKNSLDSLLAQLCQCRELSQDIIVRISEKRFLNELNKKIRHKFRDRFRTSAMKINCLIQATFGCLNIEACLFQDSAKAIRSGQRVSRCLLEIFHHLLPASPDDRYAMHFQTIVSATRLAQAFRTKLWHDSSYVVRQLPKIGPTFASTLVENGYTSFDKLISSNPREIEFCLKRNPPFGSFLVEEVKNLPKYGLSLKVTDCNMVLNGETKFKHLIRSKTQVEFQCWVNQRTDEAKLNTVILKPETHFVSLIVGCEECDQIISLHRTNDRALVHNFLAQKILLIRTQVKVTFVDKPEMVDPQLLDIIKQVEGESANDRHSLPPVHYMAQNQSVHTIRALLISESFAGLDVETKLVVRFNEDSVPGCTASPATTSIVPVMENEQFFDDDDDDQLSILLDDFHQSPTSKDDTEKNHSDNSSGSDLDFSVFEKSPRPSLPDPIKRKRKTKQIINPERPYAHIIEAADQIAVSTPTTSRRLFDDLDPPPKLPLPKNLAVETNLLGKMTEYSKRFRGTMASAQERNDFVRSVIPINKPQPRKRSAILSFQQPSSSKLALSKYFPDQE